MKLIFSNEPALYERRKEHGGVKDGFYATVCHSMKMIQGAKIILKGCHSSFIQSPMRQNLSPQLKINKYHVKIGGLLIIVFIHLRSLGIQFTPNNPPPHENGR